MNNTVTKEVLDSLGGLKDTINRQGLDRRERAARLIGGGGAGSRTPRPVQPPLGRTEQAQRRPAQGRGHVHQPGIIAHEQIGDVDRRSRGQDR